MLDKQAPGSASMRVWIDEERLNLPSRHDHESDRPVGFVNNHPYRYRRKKLFHFDVDRCSISRRKKVMRRVDRAPPDHH
jgi:hypothetical protein